MLTVRSEIGPYQKATQRFYRDASHWAKAPFVRKKRIVPPHCFSFLGWHEHKDKDEFEHD